MKKLTLTNRAQDNVTVLENEFIDQYMVKANGEYVKVYLLLLRCLNESSGTLSVSEIADRLDCTEKDVVRALNYWKKEGLLDYCDAQTLGVKESPANASVPEEARVREPELTDVLPDADASLAASDFSDPAQDTSDPQAAPNIQQYRSREERKEFKELLFVAEQYLGKTLSPTDVDAITYFFDTLHMSAELIEYLIEYCVENGHKSMHYIQKVALSWSEQNISTVSAAKSNTILYNKNCYSVLNAYGIKGRSPASSEIAYIKKWTEEYSFSLDIILEACNRTIRTIHQPNFEYTDKILKNWFSRKVRRLSDIAAADASFLKEKEQKKKAASPAPTKKTDKFNNFDGRSYDMNDLERKLVQQ